ncbi:MAG: sigma-70 family RNA polymerase sigma factor [Actinobacteria bacterium]|nr:sigma-70 family RNA polymerase sigma factor [Actinomycetota bacterium]
MAQPLSGAVVPSSEALVGLTAQGDVEALGRLYDALGSRAYGLALRVVRDPGLAEDVVQEAFLSVWRSAATFDAHRGGAQTWILTLVHRRAVDLVRREARREESPVESPPEVVSQSAAKTAATWAERRRVRSALDALTEKQRRALELAYYGGYSQSEIADRLGVPLGTIKSRMFGGLARLRELLSEPEESAPALH